MSERDLVFRISVSGQAEAISQIRRVTDEAKRLAIEEKKATDTVVGARVAAKKRGADEEKRLAESVHRTQIALEKQHAKESVRAAEGAERSKLRAVQQGEKERERAMARAGKAIVDAMNREVREFERAEKEKGRIAARETRLAASEQARISSQSMRDERQRLRDHAFEVRRFYKSIATGMVSGLVGGGRIAAQMGGRVLSRGVHGIAAGLGVGEAIDVGDIVRERANVNRKLTDIAIESRAAGGKFDFNQASAGRNIREAARTTGIRQDDLIEALDIFAEKGKGAEGAASIGRVAQEARGMGTETATVARLRAQLLVSAAARGQNLSEAQLQKMVAQTAFIGKSGVFRAKDIAEQSDSLFSAFGASGQSFDKDFGRFVSFAQTARESVGSSATARTAIVAAMDAVTKKSSKIHDLGVKTEIDGQQRNFIDVFKDVVRATGGDQEKIGKIFEAGRAGKAFKSLISTFHGAGGGEKGIAAMEARLQSNMGQGATVAEFNKDIAKSLESEEAQFAKAIEEIRQTIATTLQPALKWLGENIKDVVAHIQTAIGFVREHPGLALATGASTMALAGMAKGGAYGLARYMAGRMVNTVPGVGRLAGGAVGSVLSEGIASAGATRVFVTNWPGGGGFGGGGGIGTGAGIGGGILGAEVAGGLTAGSALGLAGVSAGMLAIAGYLREKKGDPYDIGGKGPKTRRKATAGEMSEVQALEDKKAEDREGMLQMLNAGPAGDLSSDPIMKHMGRVPESLRAAPAQPTLFKSLGLTAQGSGGADALNAQFGVLSKTIAEANEALRNLASNAGQSQTQQVPRR